MVYILIHGLGQNETSWNQVESLLLQQKIKVRKVSLYQLLQNQDFTYENLFESFVQYCLQFQEKVSLCGLSLGGILAMDFAKAYPQHIQSLIVIGAPYKIPRLLFSIQNIIFHLMPQSTFKKMGINGDGFGYIVLLPVFSGFLIIADLGHIHLLAAALGYPLPLLASAAGLEL